MTAAKSTIPKIISVDDHVVEPPHLWETRLPAKYKDVGPRVKILPRGEPTLKDGVWVEAPGDGPEMAAWWHYEDHIYQLRQMIAQRSEQGGGQRQQRDPLEAAGAVDTFNDAPVQAAGWHLMGTARMGTDPAKSVVNEWGRAHDVKNLFIVDGSIFVTSAGVNPCSTIQALALYIADRIKSNLNNLFD